jgi:hypothetical protein
MSELVTSFEFLAPLALTCLKVLLQDKLVFLADFLVLS